MTGDEVWIEPAESRVGSDAHYAEEAPSRVVAVDGFWIDRFQVTNRRYAAFVAEAGYVSVAERPLDPADFPGAPAENLVPGSLVFTRTRGPVDLRHISQWWTWTPGACWRYPEGPGSELAGREEHPVVHVAYEDAAAYAEWAGATLPTEVQWERAARRGARRRRLRLGRRARARRQPARQLLARRLPVAGGAGLRDDRAGRLVPAQRVRALRHGRQRVGMDGRLVRRQRGSEP
jgi:formylglycine-generating enzyme required for sulfatase activity